MPSNLKRIQGKLIAWMLPRIQRWFRRAPYLKALARGEAIGRLIWRLAKRRRETGEANLALAFPELSSQERAGICKRVFENFGRSSADFFFGLDRTFEQLSETTTVTVGCVLASADVVCQIMRPRRSIVMPVGTTPVSE